MFFWWTGRWDSASTHLSQGLLDVSADLISRGLRKKTTTSRGGRRKLGQPWAPDNWSILACAMGTFRRKFHAELEIYSLWLTSGCETWPILMVDVQIQKGDFSQQCGNVGLPEDILLITNHRSRILVAAPCWPMNSTPSRHRRTIEAVCCRKQTLLRMLPWWFADPW